MSITSDWPLHKDGIRLLVPHLVLTQLRHHPLTQGLYLIATGYYPEAMDHRMSRQKHDNHLLIYCTAGKGRVVVGNDDHQITSGDLVLLPKGLSHHYEADKQQPWSIYWLHYDGHLSEEFNKLLVQGQVSLSQGQALVGGTGTDMEERRERQTRGQTLGNQAIFEPRQTIGIHPRVIATFRALFNLQSSGSSREAFINGCHRTQQLLSFLAVLTRQHQSLEAKTIDLEQLKAFMRKHINGHLSLEQIAAQVKLSKYHFSKRFRDITGMSPVDYFINLKIQEACIRLDNSLRPIKSIALELGYQDPYYFSRIFKKAMGMSPAKYRASQHR